MEATETFKAGVEQATVVVQIDLNAVWLISGDFSGTIPSGQIGFINGDVNLTGNVYVEGLLTGIDTFHVQGNGFTIFFQNGGTAELAGKAKAAWGEWGTDTTGWLIGDRLAISPTKVGTYLPIPGTWTGSWTSMVRPINAPDFTPLGRPTRKPEVANLSQTVVFENLARGFHVHDSGGQIHLSDVKFYNCGSSGLGNYPMHFHMVGENSRGSTLTRVVVENGKNHAFVPHASHGITYQDCVAFNTSGDPFWWDPPPSVNDTVNNSHDIAWLHCLAIGLSSPSGDTRLSAFVIGAGNGNRCIDCVATSVRGTGQNISGFLWRENSVWEFDGCTTHNTQKNGIYVWTNSPHVHPITDYTAYHFARAGIEHGAYRNRFTYRNVSLTVTNPIFTFGSSDTQAIRQHANSSGLLFEDIVSDDRLVVDGHSLPYTSPTIHRRCHYTKVYYGETGGSGGNLPSYLIFEDCGLVPANFGGLGGGIFPDSIIEIVEGGTLTHRWTAGVWT